MLRPGCRAVGLRQVDGMPHEPRSWGRAATWVVRSVPPLYPRNSMAETDERPLSDHGSRRLPVQLMGHNGKRPASTRGVDLVSHWTDSGAARDRRQLKHRAVGDGRTVPCPPELTELLHAHLDAFGTAGEGWLFRGERGGELPIITIGRAWRAARARAFTAEVAAGPLARRPYDLRHAAVSTWLNGGVPPQGASPERLRRNVVQRRWR